MVSCTETFYSDNLDVHFTSHSKIRSSENYKRPYYISSYSLTDSKTFDFPEDFNYILRSLNDFGRSLGKKREGEIELSNFEVSTESPL